MRRLLVPPARFVPKCFAIVLAMAIVSMAVLAWSNRAWSQTGKAAQCTASMAASQDPGAKLPDLVGCPYEAFADYLRTRFQTVTVQPLVSNTYPAEVITAVQIKPASPVYAAIMLNPNRGKPDAVVTVSTGPGPPATPNTGGTTKPAATAFLVRDRTLPRTAAATFPIERTGSLRGSYTLAYTINAANLIVNDGVSDYVGFAPNQSVAQITLPDLACLSRITVTIANPEPAAPIAAATAVGTISGNPPATCPPAGTQKPRASTAWWPFVAALLGIAGVLAVVAALIARGRHWWAFTPRLNAVCELVDGAVMIEALEHPLVRLPRIDCCVTIEDGPAPMLARLPLLSVEPIDA
jgi:hypothetical protein